MKIVHLCLGCFYPDGFSYQENMLPKFHKNMGYDVEVIASLFTFDTNGKGMYLPKAKSYQNEYEILVNRLDYRKPLRIYRKLKGYIGAYEVLENSNPDILFIHGIQFIDVKLVVKYLKKHPDVKVFVDNHADFSNSATNFFSKTFLHKILWRHMAHLIEPYVIKFYGVLPARVDFLKDIYKLPAEKCELLVMGADDDAVEYVKINNFRDKIRKKYGIKDDDFCIVTGGKIDSFKMQALTLMEAVSDLGNPKMKLLVFGSIENAIKDRFDSLCDGTKIQYMGWAKGIQSYEYFSAADLVVFPGRHSVYWEQVAGMGIPMVCKYWEGTTHVDIGGNVVFLKTDKKKEIGAILNEIIEFPRNYERMLKTAQGIAKDKFSYRKIAAKAIEVGK